MRPVYLAGVAAMFCAMQAMSLRADDPSSVWEAAFPIATAPTHVHFHARYLDGRGAPHTLEVWRDGEQRLKRKSDAAIDLYAEQKAGGEIDFHIVDHLRGIVLRANRGALPRGPLFRMARISPRARRPARRLHGSGIGSAT